MGRIYKRRATTGNTMRLELRWMLDNGYFKPGEEVRSTIAWESGSTVSVLTRETSLRLTYTLTKPTGETLSQSYTVSLAKIPSNLGKGEILYFVCPVSGRKCRILYLAYGSNVFKCREAYSYKIYYELQACSKLQRNNIRYFILEDKLGKLCRKKATYMHQGKLTKRADQIMRLEERREAVDLLRTLELVKFCKKF